MPLLLGSTRAEDMADAAERATISFGEGEVTFRLLEVDEPEPRMTLAEITAHREALVEMGLVRWNGTYRPDGDGVPQKVWVAIPEVEVTNPEGLAFLEEGRATASDEVSKGVRGVEVEPECDSDMVTIQTRRATRAVWPC